MNLSIRTKELSKIGYTDNVARSIATTAINKHCKRRTKQEVLAELADVLQNPSAYAGHEAWGRLSEYFCPQEEQVSYACYGVQGACKIGIYRKALPNLDGAKR